MAKVLIAVGHGVKPDGSYDPGATAGGKTEQDEGDKIARACASRLSAAGVDVIDESYSKDPNFSGTIDTANRAGVDLVVSIHHDWSGAPRGAFGHWYPGSSAGRRLADAIRDQLKAQLGYRIRDGWHKARSDLSLLKRTRMPAVIWECDRIGTVKNHKAYGRAVADGILDHLGITPPSGGGSGDQEEGIVANLPKIDLSGIRDGRPGSYVRGGDVKRLQALLAANGHPPDDSFDDDGEPDGSGGPGTKDALGGFQKRHGTGKASSPSTPDYVVGPATWSALLGVS